MANLGSNNSDFNLNPSNFSSKIPKNILEKIHNLNLNKNIELTTKNDKYRKVYSNTNNNIQKVDSFQSRGIPNINTNPTTSTNNNISQFNNNMNQKYDTQNRVTSANKIKNNIGYNNEAGLYQQSNPIINNITQRSNSAVYSMSNIADSDSFIEFQESIYDKFK